jgi:hypothetical protein
MPTVIQSIMFKKQYWTLKRAKAWLKEHGYDRTGVDETDNYYRFRQVDPDEFNKKSFRTIELKPSVKAVVGKPLNNNPKVPNWASTIIWQMGGYQRMSAMIGLKQIVVDEDKKQVLFKFPNRQRSKANAVYVKLQPNDEYEVRFNRIGKKKGFYNNKNLATFEDIQWEQLIPLFEKQTGLYLRF